MSSTSICSPRSAREWMPKGAQLEVRTPSKNQKHYLAAALGCGHRADLLLPGAEEKQRPLPQAAGSPPADLREALSQDLCRLRQLLNSYLGCSDLEPLKHLLRDGHLSKEISYVIYE